MEPFTDYKRRTVEYWGDEDWFNFETNGAATFRLHLRGSSPDYDFLILV
jgi:hypothetical protein